MRNYLLFGILAIISFLAAAFLIIKQKLDKLDIYVTGIKFRKISIEELTGTLKLIIRNPFGKVEVSNLNLDLYIDNYYVSKLEQSSQSKTEMLPNGDIRAYVDFFIKPKKVVSIEHLLMSLAQAGRNEYTIKGSINVKKWFITAKIPIDYTSTFKSEEE